MTKKSNFQKILEFAILLNKFREVTRGLLVNNTDRWENDVEHSYMLTMLADYIISADNLSLNRSKVIKYALVHDLVEVYAGDTYVYSKDVKHIDSKKEREKEALDKVILEFPEYSSVRESVEGFENQIDDEAKFVYALDKLQPMIQIYLDNGKSWHEKKVDFEEVMTKKDNTMKGSPTIEKYWTEFRKILEQNKSTLFPKR